MDVIVHVWRQSYQKSDSVNRCLGLFTKVYLLLAEESWQISSRSGFKRRSLRLFLKGAPAPRRRRRRQKELLRRYSCDISALSAIEMRCIILRYINVLFYFILFYSILRRRRRRTMTRISKATMSRNMRWVPDAKPGLTSEGTSHFKPH